MLILFASRIIDGAYRMEYELARQLVTIRHGYCPNIKSSIESGSITKLLTLLAKLGSSSTMNCPIYATTT
jgi:hypothetical protein